MSKEVFELRKVVNPHRHMPEEIKESFFEGTQDWEMGNDSYVEWTVGSHQDVEEDEDFPEDTEMKKVDDWMLQHFQSGETVIILHWW